MQSKLIALVGAVLGAVGVLALAYTLDARLEHTRLLASTAVNERLVRQLQWGNGLANLLVAGAFILLAAWVYPRAGHSRLLALLLILIGLPAALSVGLFWSTAPWIDWPFTVVPFIIPTSRFSIVGALLAALGLALLLKPRPPAARPALE